MNADKIASTGQDYTWHDQASMILYLNKQNDCFTYERITWRSWPVRIRVRLITAVHILRTCCLLLLQLLLQQKLLLLLLLIVHQ